MGMRRIPKNRLAYWRRQRGLSQRELAEIIGCFVTAIGKYERGELDMSTDVRARLSRALNCSPADLLAPSELRAECSPVQMVPIFNLPLTAVTYDEIMKRLQTFHERVAVSSFSERLIAVKVNTTEIENVAVNGSIVIIDTDDLTLEDCGYYLVSMAAEGGQCLRRYRSTDGPPRFEPDGRASRDVTICSENDFSVIGRVVSVQVSLR